jgi:hypothetical protein
VQVLQAVFKGRRHFGKDLLDGTHAVDAGDAVELVILADDRHGLCLVFLACQETTLPVRTPQPKNPVKLKLSLLACALGLAIAAVAEADTSRVFVLTDISNEPDDEQSMVRFLVDANKYDVEGLVATTSP